MESPQLRVERRLEVQVDLVNALSTVKTCAPPFGAIHGNGHTSSAHFDSTPITNEIGVLFAVRITALG